MNYYDLLLQKKSDRVFLVSHENKITYKEFILLVEKKTDEMRNNFIPLCEGSKLYYVQENSILKELVSFFAAQKLSLIPAIVAKDLKEFPEYKTVSEYEKKSCMAVLTSGSSGVPKLFFRTYESWANFFPMQNEIFNVDKDSMLFANGSLCFTGNLNLYMAQVFAGASICFSDSMNIRMWQALIEQNGPSHLYLVPSKLMLFVTNNLRAENIFPSVKMIVSGSQSLGRNDADKIKKVFMESKIILYYGASEMNYISYIEDRYMTDEKNIVGKPFPEVSVEVRGEEIFVTNDFHVEGVQCPYTLHDTGYFDSKGLLHFTGRSDDIVNVHGRKVSLLRIENQCESLDDVESCIAKTFESNGKTKISLHAVTSLSTEELFGKLKTVLYDYEIPAEIIIEKEIKLNASGKKIRR